MTVIQGPGERYDAVIVGARCAGAATAMLLARAGLRVLVVDREAYGRDTLSTHALMRTGVELLHRWGVLDRIVAEGTPVVRRTTFIYGDETIDVDIKAGNGFAGLCAPRRTVLDRLLVDAASAAGARVRYGVAATGICRNGEGRVTGVRIRNERGCEEVVSAGIVIGADGRASRIADAVGARVLAMAPATSAGVYGYFRGIENRGFRWYFRRGAHLAVIPTNDGAHCVCAVVPRHHYKFVFGSAPDRGLAEVIEGFDWRLADAVLPALPETRLRRWAGAEGHLRECEGPGWALVGDAGYFKDPMTAHGITDALRDAELLSRAILEGGRASMARYRETRDRLSRTLFNVTGEIAGFQWTLEELKAKHRTLSAAMKDEHAYMFDEAEMAEKLVS